MISGGEISVAAEQEDDDFTQKNKLNKEKCYENVMAVQDVMVK